MAIVTLADCPTRQEGNFIRVDAPTGTMEFSPLAKKFYGPSIVNVMAWKCGQCLARDWCQPKIDKDKIVSRLREP